MPRQQPGSQMQDRLARVNTTTAARLDRLGTYFPARKEALPFDEYLARASVQAQADPEFANQFQQAMQQYRMASEVIHGNK